MTVPKSTDRVDRIRLSLLYVPLRGAVSDAKVPTEVEILLAEIGTADGFGGFGFSYARRAGGPGMYAHAKEISPQLLGEDPSDIGRIWDKLVWPARRSAAVALPYKRSRRSTSRCGT